MSVRQNLSVLNGPIARMTSLICIIFCELTIIGKFVIYSGSLVNNLI